MKTLNLLACIFFALLCVGCILAGLIQKRYDLVIFSFIPGAVSYVAYTDIVDPE